MTMAASSLETQIQGLLPELDRVYTDIHAHPELPMQETRTARIAGDRVRNAGYEVTDGIGQTGVVELLRNGEGPTVMLRADMDALPVREPAPAVCQHADGNRQHRQDCSGHACLRSRHACDLANRRGSHRVEGTTGPNLDRALSRVSAGAARGRGQHDRHDGCHDHEQIERQRNQRRLADGDVVLTPGKRDHAFQPPR